IGPLTNPAGSQVGYAPNRVFRALLRRVPHQSQLQPMTCGSCYVTQDCRIGVELIDHQVKASVSIKVSNRKTATRPCIGKSSTRRCAHAFKSPVPQVAKKESLLREAGSPLIRI